MSFWDWSYKRGCLPARTASAAFLERAAGQLGLCAVELAHDDSGPSGDKGSAELVTAYGRQLAPLGKQHAQAEHEPLAQALDSSRRGALLALIQDFFDAPSLEACRLDRTPSQPDAEADILALRAAAQGLDEALESSTKNMVEALRGNLVEVDNQSRGRRSRPSTRDSTKPEAASN